VPKQAFAVVARIWAGFAAMTSMGSNWAAFFLRKLLIPMRLMYGTEGAFQEVLMSCEVVYWGRHGRNRERYICHPENSATEVHNLTQNLMSGANAGRRSKCLVSISKMVNGWELVASVVSTSRKAGAREISHSANYEMPHTFLLRQLWC
jgi:hypothetical protein